MRKSTSSARERCLTSGILALHICVGHDAILCRDHGLLHCHVDVQCDCVCWICREFICDNYYSDGIRILSNSLGARLLLWFLDMPQLKCHLFVQLCHGFVAIIAHFIMSQIRKLQMQLQCCKGLSTLSTVRLGEGMINLATQDLVETLNFGDEKGPFDWNITGLPITYMLIEGSPCLHL